MKKNIFIILLTASAMVYFIFFNPRLPKERPNPPVATQKVQKSLADEIRKFPGLSKPRLSAQEKQSACKEALESIETLPISTLIYDLKQNKFKLNSDCLFASKNNIAILSGFPEVCENLVNNEPTKDCLEKLFFYKVLRIHHATSNDDLRSLPTEIIISKLIALMVKNDFTSEGLETMRAVGAQIYERLPNSESAAKAAAIGYFADEHLSDDDKVMYNKILDEGRAKFPENWDIYEMDLVRKKINNKDSFEEEVESYFQSRPESAVANYHMGCIHWTDSRAIEARSFFQRAVQLGPNNTRFTDTLRKSKTTAPPEKVCTVQIGFDPEKF